VDISKTRLEDNVHWAYCMIDPICLYSNVGLTIKPIRQGNWKPPGGTTYTDAWSIVDYMQTTLVFVVLHSIRSCYNASAVFQMYAHVSRHVILNAVCLSSMTIVTENIETTADLTRTVFLLCGRLFSSVWPFTGFQNPFHHQMVPWLQYTRQFHY